MRGRTEGRWDEEGDDDRRKGRGAEAMAEDDVGRWVEDSPPAVGLSEGCEVSGCFAGA